MTNKDTSLFTVRASNFGLLMSDDEVEEVNNSVVSEEPQQEAFASTPSASVEENGDDWACVTKKTRQAKKSFTPSKQQNSNNWNAGNATRLQGKPHQAHQAGGYRKGHAPHTPPLTVDQLSSELTVEVYDFPAAWRTADLKKLFAPFEGQYRLKWQSDTSCWFHFSTAELAGRAMDEVKPEEAKIRPFLPENVLFVTPKADLQGIDPETTFELHAFPATWQASDINGLLSSFSGKYRIKWRHDSQVLIIFEDKEVMEAARGEVLKCVDVKVSAFVPPPKDH